MTTRIPRTCPCFNTKFGKFTFPWVAILKATQTRSGSDMVLRCNPRNDCWMYQCTTPCRTTLGDPLGPMASTRPKPHLGIQTNRVSLDSPGPRPDRHRRRRRRCSAHTATRRQRQWMVLTGSRTLSPSLPCMSRSNSAHGASSTMTLFPSTSGGKTLGAYVSHWFSWPRGPPEDNDVS